MSLATELVTNAVQVCVMMGTLALLLGGGWVGELVVDGFDRLLGPLGPASLAVLAWDEGVALLGCVPEVGVNLLLAKVCVSAGVLSAPLPGRIKRETGPTQPLLS